MKENPTSEYYSINSHFQDGYEFLYKLYIYESGEEVLHFWVDEQRYWEYCGGTLNGLQKRKIEPEEIALMVGVL